MEIPNKTKLYLGFLATLALSLYIIIILEFSIDNISMFIFWATLAIVVESLLIPMPNNKVGVSVGYAINIATIIIGGPLLATTTAGLGFLLRAPKIKDRGFVHVFNLPIHKSIFNVSQSVIVTAVMSYVYLFLGGTIGEFSLISTIFVIIIGVVINTSIISGFLSISNNLNFVETWISNIKGFTPSAVAVGT